MNPPNKRRSTGTTPVPVERLEADLARDRQVADAHRADELDRKQAEARHGRDLADVAEDARRAELDRAEREATATADAALARMYREARAAGERARVTSQMARSGEVRALRLERLRVLNLKVLVPVLLGFAAWSTTGVHHGAARLMAVGAWNADPMWWALWLLEPVLIGAVVWVTIVRARLAATGGTIDNRAVHLAYACLAVSIFLNLTAGAPHHPPGAVSAWLAVAAAMLAHAVGPTGAAATAHLIGIVDESIADADPWTENGEPVPLLADLDLRLASAPSATAPEQPAAEPSSDPELFTDAALAAWIDGGDPPSGGPVSSPPTPDADGPHGATNTTPTPPAAPASAGVDIDAEQLEGGDEPEGTPRVESAIRARLAAGAATRRRVAAYIADHPEHANKPTRIAEALGMGKTTVKEHLRALRKETDR